MKYSIHWTSRINDAIADSTQMSKDVLTATSKFLNHDWGITCTSDAKLNDESLKTGDRILAVYNTCKGKIWINADWVKNPKSKRHIVIMFPNDY